MWAIIGIIIGIINVAQPQRHYKRTKGALALDYKYYWRSGQWCQRPQSPLVKQHYNVRMSAQCHNSVLVPIRLQLLLGCKAFTTNNPTPFSVGDVELLQCAHAV